jgi:DNA polymerase-3 subunit gamma/tau
VKFLLATTDPQKLPVTVLSRCLQFNLKRLPASLIAGRLQQILAAEGIASEAPAIVLLARAADGSLRDALSLLDQMLAYGAGRVTETDARAMLGTVDRRQVVQLVDAIADRDARALFGTIAEIDEFAPDYGQLLDEIAAVLQRVALRQAVPDLPHDEVWPVEALDALAARLPAEDVQLAYQLAILGRRDLELAPDPRTGFEMTLLRILAFRPADSAGGSRQRAGERTTSLVEARAAVPESAPPQADGDWPALLAKLELRGPARQLAGHCPRRQSFPLPAGCPRRGPAHAPAGGPLLAGASAAGRRGGDPRNRAGRRRRHAGAARRAGPRRAYRGCTSLAGA